MSISTLVALGGFLALHSSPPQEIVLRETPRPEKYQLAMRVECGPRFYDIAVEVRGGLTSRLVHAKANNTAVEFHSVSTGNGLEESLGQVGVTGLTPTRCDSETGEITVVIDGYDPELDAQPARDGHITWSFVADIS